MAYRFIKPETTRLALSQNDWVDVKQTLSFGDSERLRGYAFFAAPSANEDIGAAGAHWEAYKISRLLLQITDWSLTDEAGKAIPLSRDAIAVLDVDFATELEEAITKYRGDQENLKNSQEETPKEAGKPKLKALSTS